MLIVSYLWKSYGPIQGRFGFQAIMGISKKDRICSLAMTRLRHKRSEGDILQPLGPTIGGGGERPPIRPENWSVIKPSTVSLY